MVSTSSFNARYYKLSPPDRYDGHQWLDIEVNLDRAALMLVDVYGVGFEDDEGSVRLHPSVSMTSSHTFDSIARDAIAPALAAARVSNLPVIYVHNSGPRIELNRSELGKVLNRTLDGDLEELFREDGVDPREYYSGSENLFLEISRMLAPEEGDYFIRKHQYSGFRDTRLDSLLRNLDIETLFCAGFDAGTCLKMTMVDAFELNYELVLLRDAAAALEIPEDIAIGYSFTERIIWWMEAHIGTSIESAQFVQAMKTRKP